LATTRFVVLLEVKARETECDTAVGGVSSV
jgi:hypothetical protein